MPPALEDAPRNAAMGWANPGGVPRPVTDACPYCKMKSHINMDAHPNPSGGGTAVDHSFPGPGSRGEPQHRDAINLKIFRVGILSVLVLASTLHLANAGSATWNLSPGTNNWNTNANWTPNTGYPNGSSDTATFALSNTTNISISANVEVKNLTFTSAATNAYTITLSPSFTFTVSALSGVGITNNSGIAQHFVMTSDVAGNSSVMELVNGATAGGLTTFTNKGALLNGGGVGITTFRNNATASSAMFINEGGTVGGGGGGGGTGFNDVSTAANGTFMNNGGTVNGAIGGHTDFFNTATAGSGTFNNNAGTVNGASGGSTTFGNSGGFVSTAGNGTFVNSGAGVVGAGVGTTLFNSVSTASNGTFVNNAGTVAGASGGFTRFTNSATAANSTLIANGGAGNGGSIRFLFASTGGTARVQVFGNGNLDISSHNAGSLGIGSLEGTGNVFLGANNLSVGGANLTTIFSGVIQDGGIGGGVGGSLTKTGTGTLNLGGPNTYTGATTVSAGTLSVTNTTGSGTGTGAVTANGGILSGTGTINGPVTINSGAALLAGKGTTASGTLTLTNNLTLNANSTIQLVLGASGAHSTLARGGGTWTFASNQSFTLVNGGAQPGVYNNVISGLAADPGTEGSWTITNPGFTGTFTYDGAGGIDLNLTTVHPQIAGALSAKSHTGVGTFFATLPLDGSVGIESRSGGNSNDYQMVIGFTNNISGGAPQAAVTSGQAQVGSNGIPNGGAVFVNGASITVPLTNVANAQTIAVTLFNVSDGTNIGDVTVAMALLSGDTTGDGVVNSADISQVKSKSGQGVDGTNFRNDLNVDGALNSADISLVKSRSGTGLPASPSEDRLRHY